METMDEIIANGPLVNPDLLNKDELLYESENLPADLGESEEPYIEGEVTENNARNATIEDIIRLLLTGTAPGLTFSANATTKAAEIERLNKWLRIKLFTKVNDQNLRNGFITFARSLVPSISFALGFLVLLINHIFDFKNRIVRNAISEYNTWLSTRVNATYAIKEYDADALPLLTKYWNATPSPPSPVNPRTFWSAAFISWIIKESGGMDLFSYSGAHITYMRAAKRNSNTTAQNPFWMYSITDFITRMQPGDLVCKARAGSGLTFTNVLTNADTAAHVDIITEIDRPNNKIRVLGGNVCDNVDHKRLNIVGTSRITNSDGEDYFAGIGIGNA